MERAVFIDRDGTLNEEVGYVNHLSRFRLFDFAAKAIRLLNKAGWRTFVVTNQSGVARGFFDEELVKRVHSHMLQQLARDEARLDGIYWCPHHPTAGQPPYRRECDCRKPLPGLLHRAAQEFNLNLAKSVVIGDRYLDVNMAHQAGAKGVLVLTGYGLGEYEYHRNNWPTPPDYVANDVLDAVNWVLRNDSAQKLTLNVR
jgi:D-glycero-D-manno-heptose 1,7-bisphosphate phosphatase